jgi:MFS-type transporter involved in bile tolerance (Atg22 family)
VAIIFVALFLLVGLTILFSVNEAKARQAATTPIPVSAD